MSSSASNMLHDLILLRFPHAGTLQHCAGGVLVRFGVCVPLKIGAVLHHQSLRLTCEALPFMAMSLLPYASLVRAFVTCQGNVSCRSEIDASFNLGTGSTALVVDETCTISKSFAAEPPLQLAS